MRQDSCAAFSIGSKKSVFTRTVKAESESWRSFFGRSRLECGGRRKTCRIPSGAVIEPRKEVRHRKEEKAQNGQEGNVQEETPPTQGDMQCVRAGDRHLCAASGWSGTHMPELCVCAEGRGNVTPLSRGSRKSPSYGTTCRTTGRTHRAHARTISQGRGQWPHFRDRVFAPGFGPDSAATIERDRRHSPAMSRILRLRSSRR